MPGVGYRSVVTTPAAAVDGGHGVGVTPATLRSGGAMLTGGHAAGGATRAMSTISAERVRVGTVAEVIQRGCTVVAAGGHGIAVFAHEGRLHAVDNRCPHMGFPLSRGTVRDGLLT